MNEGALEPRGIKKDSGGVIMNETAPLDPFEEAVLGDVREGDPEEVERLKANAVTDAELIMAEEIRGFDEMHMIEKIQSLSELLERMRADFDNSERYAYREIVRRKRLLETTLEYRERMNRLGNEFSLEQTPFAA